MTTKKLVIAITGAKSPGLWYADMIGKQFKVEKETSWGYYLVQETGFLKSIVFKQDTKLI